MWIEGIAPPEATGELKDLYERIGGGQRRSCAYFSFANRLVMGLGVALEPGFEETCRPDMPQI